MRRMLLLVGVTALVSMAVVGAVGCGGGSDSSTGRTYKDAAGNTCDEGDAHFGDEWSKSGLDVSEVWCPASASAGAKRASTPPPPVKTDKVWPASGSAGSGQARWVITDLGSLGSGYSTATAINDMGQVVGRSRTANGERHVFLWENGRMADLGRYGGNPDDDYLRRDPLINARGQVVWVWPGRGAVVWANGVVRNLGTGRAYAEVNAINDRGQVVGWANSNGRDSDGDPIAHAFLWQSGRLTDLRGDSWGQFGMDINERGQIVGLLDHGQATVWENGKLRRLGTLGGKRSEAVAINDRGQVTGTATRHQREDSLGNAFLWQNGKMTDLGEGNEPLAINNRGEIIFWGGWGSREGYVWQNGRFVTLGTLGGRRLPDPAAINAEGQVVGSAVAKFGSRTQWHAFVSQNGVMTDLGTLPGGKSSDAVAINDKGQIVGTSPSESAGHGDRAVLWTLRSG